VLELAHGKDVLDRRARAVRRRWCRAHRATSWCSIGARFDELVGLVRAAVIAAARRGAAHPVLVLTGPTAPAARP
jgi:hypothetical protein